MIIATTRDCLEQSTISYVTHEDTMIRTALGSVVIVEVTKPGVVLIAGPSSKKTMIKLKQSLQKYQPYKLFIDGALFRKSIATKELVDGIIFVTGASYSSNIDKVVRDTNIVIDQYRIKETNNVIKNYVNNNENNYLVFENNRQITKFKENLLHNEQELVKYIDKTTTALYIPRSLTEKMIEAILSIFHKPCNFEIIVQDATFILVKPEIITKFLKLGGKISVLNPIDIVFIAYNPTSPYGYSFDNNEFRAKLSSLIGLRPINVLQDLE